MGCWLRGCWLLEGLAPNGLGIKFASQQQTDMFVWPHCNSILSDLGTEAYIPGHAGWGKQIRTFMDPNTSNFGGTPALVRYHERHQILPPQEAVQEPRHKQAPHYTRHELRSKKITRQSLKSRNCNNSRQPLKRGTKQAVGCAKNVQHAT